MKTRNLFYSSASLIVMAVLMLFTIGCSGDNNNSTGPETSPPSGVAYDEISVSLNRLSVTYDCDYDPAGVTQPGDFYYSLNIDTLSDNGTDWLSISSNKAKFAEINNGGYKDITDQKASVRLPRREGQAFRVNLTLRESDAGGNDFSSTHRTIHVHKKASTQLYAPEGGNYSYYSSSLKTGTMNWNINKRDRSWVLGVLTVEGCQANMSYTVKVLEVN